jgi:S1-C subfamily serine protease
VLTRCLQWSCIVVGVAAAVLGCASRGNTPPASESTSSANVARQRQEADTFKAQARQGLIDFLREKPRPPKCEVGYLSGQQLTVLATSEWVERAGLRRGDRIISAEEIPVASLDGRPLPPSAVGPVVPHKVVVARGGRQLTLTLPCVVNPEVWVSARRIQEAAAVGDWDRCQAAALEYIHSVGFFEALALEFRGRCGFYRTMLRGEGFNLDMARDLYEWQTFRLREKSYEPGGLEEVKESVLAGIGVLRREGYREHAENLEDQLRSVPGRVAAELANPQPGPVAAQPTPFGQPTPFAPPAHVAPPVPVALPTPVTPPTPVAPPAPTAPRPVPPSPPPTPVATQPPPPPRPAPAPQLVPTAASSQGTAFFVRPDGVLLTALHVVEGARSIVVRCPGREPASATVSNSARGQDLAVLKTSLAAPAYLNVREARSVEPGDAIFTVGFPAAPAANAGSKFSDGSVSAVTGPDAETAFLQMTVPTQPGNSGGPVVAGDGSVVGVVSSITAIIPLLRAPSILPQNVSWAIKADFGRPLFAQPPAMSSPKNRQEAIDRVTQAACQVMATR